MQLTRQEYLDKCLTAFLRNGNYAHAGEEEAILLVMNKFAKKNNQQILDAGCGLGGTANFIQLNGWGKVTGFDIEPLSTNYAKKCYLEVDFYVCDIIKIGEIFKNKFDILCLFNSFYAFHDQKTALASLNKAAKLNSSLVIFDYLDLCDKNTNPIRSNKDDLIPFFPIRLDVLYEQFTATGWIKSETITINDEYQKWYTNLLTKLVENKETILKMFGQNAYDRAYDRYKKTLDVITNKMLGGVIVYAKKSKNI